MSFLEKLKNLNQQEQFQPGLIGLFINASYFMKRGVFNGIRTNAHLCKGRLLDVGCGNKPYRSLFNVEEYIGIDIENEAHDHTHESIDALFDGINIPYDDCRFDCVISIEVFEHVFHLERLIKEINRVLVPGGNLLITLPFVWMEHEKPNDFARYTSFGIKDLLERNGFEVLKLEKSGTFIETIVQLKASYLYDTMLSRNKLIKVIGTVFLIGPLNLLGLISSMILPSNENLYLNTVILARKTQDAIGADVS
ncbi:MAG: class I SAM-dependent methyltransferase [Bacteroidota bacterium]